MEKLDKINRKILAILLEDSSAQLSRIGKKVRLSRENVHYRIQRLIKIKVITDFVTLIDYSALGFNQYTVFVEFDRINKSKESEIIKYLQNQKAISWIGVLAGNLSITFDLYARTQDELNSTLSTILTKMKENIGEYSVLNVRESAYFFHKLIEEKSTTRSQILQKECKVDQTDKGILQQLNESSRKTYVEIGEKLNLTPNAIKQRVKNLEKAGIIRGYSLSLNHKAFDLEWHGLQIKIEKPSQDIEKKLKDYFRNDSKTIFYYHYGPSGIYDFDIGVAVHDSSELRDFINDLRSNFYEEIKIKNIFLVLEEISSHKLPAIVFS